MIKYSTDEIITISSIDEILEVGIKYAHESKPSQWIRIELDLELGFCIYGIISGSQPTSVCSSFNVVKYWKTFKGVKLAIKRFSSSGSWGLRHWA